MAVHTISVHMLVFVFTVICIPRKGEILLHSILVGVNREILWEDCDIPRHIGTYTVAFGCIFTCASRGLWQQLAECISCKYTNKMAGENFFTLMIMYQLKMEFFNGTIINKSSRKFKMIMTY